MERGQECRAVAWCERFGATGDLARRAQIRHQIAHRQRHSDRGFRERLAVRCDHLGAGLHAPARQRDIRSDDDIAWACALRNPVVGGIHAWAGRDTFDQRLPRHADEIAGNHADRQAMPDGNAIDLVLHRAGVGIDINPGGMGYSHRARVVRYSSRNCEQNAACQYSSVAYDQMARQDGQIRDLKDMTSRLETYRVSAYNTSKQSENKIHDDAVARRFGFSGGLVPGVDVLAYMLHLPVAKWGRAFLERGLIEARFLKPVYDGEIADVTAAESDGGLSIEVESRSDLCATGTASLPSSPPSFSLDDFIEVPVVAERRPVSADSYEVGKWLATLPRDWAGDAAKEYLGDIRERDEIYAREGLGHPALLQRVMNKVLVDNAIVGPWIHVGSRMQLLSAAKTGDQLTARARVTGNYEKKGHRFVELEALVVANGRTPLAHCRHIAIYQPREQAAA